MRTPTVVAPYTSATSPGFVWKPHYRYDWATGTAVYVRFVKRVLSS